MGSGLALPAMPLVEGARVRVRLPGGTEYMARVERVRVVDGVSQLVVLRRAES